MGCRPGTSEERSVTQEPVTTINCRYPGCLNPAEGSDGRPGRPPAFCADPEHNSITAYHERKRLERQAAGQQPPAADAPEAQQPWTFANITAAELARQMRAQAAELIKTGERLAEAAAEIGDTGAADAEMKATRKAAEQRVATAEAALATAEQRALAAEQRASDAEDATYAMSQHMEDAERRAREAAARLSEAAAEQAT